MAAIVDAIRQLLAAREEQKEKIMEQALRGPEGPGAGHIIMMQPEKILDVYTVPQQEIHKLWGVISTDCPMSYLSDIDIEYARALVEFYNALERIFQPALPLPFLTELKDRLLKDEARRLQAELLTLCRVKRGKEGITLRAFAFGLR